MPFLLALLGVVATVGLLAVFLVPLLVDEAVLIGLAEKTVRQHTGAELVVSGGGQLSLFPTFSVSLDDASLNYPARRADAYGISAEVEQLSLALAVMPALRGEAQFSELAVDGVHVSVTPPASRKTVPELATDLSDREWEALGEKLRAEQAAERRRILASVEPSLLVAVVADALTMTNVTLDMLDNEGHRELRINVDELKLRDINTANRPIELSSRLVIQPEGDGSTFAARVTGAIRVPADLAKVTLDQIKTELTGVFSEPVNGTLDGIIELRPLRVIANVDAALPGGSLKGDLAVDPLASPGIALAMTTDHLDLDRLQPAIGGPAETPSSPRAAGAPGDSAEATTIIPPVPLPVGPLRLLDMLLTLDAGQLESGGQQMTDAELSIRVRDGVATIEKLRGTLYDGQLAATATINTRREAVEFRADGELSNVDLALMAASLGSPDTLSGEADLSWAIESAGATAEALRLGLSGDIKATGRDVVIESMSLQSLMCDAIAEINREPLSSAMPETTDLSAMDLGITLGKGRATVESLRVATLGLALGGQGSASLDNLDYNIVLSSKLDRTLGELDPACRVEERYLAVNWPIVCRGNIERSAESQCVIDSQRIVQQLLRNEAERKIQRGLRKLLDRRDES